MMHKLQFLIMAGLMTLVCSLSHAAPPPEEITIDACMNKKSAVTFPHATHFKTIECATCHHKQQELTLKKAQEGMEVKRCTGCHKDPEEADAPSCTEMSLKKNPFHVRCIGCHKERKEEGKENPGPIKCGDCHPKT